MEGNTVLESSPEINGNLVPADDSSEQNGKKSKFVTDEVSRKERSSTGGLSQHKLSAKDNGERQGVQQGSLEKEKSTLLDNGEYKVKKTTTNEA